MAFPLHLDESRVVLPEALKALAADCCRVRPPVSGGQPAEAITADADTSVDDWNQMGIGDQIEDVAAPRPVDAREQQVAVQCLPKAGLLEDGRDDRIDREVLGSRPVL